VIAAILKENVEETCGATFVEHTVRQSSDIVALVLLETEECCLWLLVRLLRFLANPAPFGLRWN